MAESVKEFLKYLDENTDTDYGDFKREVDAHLQHLLEGQRDLSQYQIERLRDLRQELLWEETEDVDSMKEHVHDEIVKIRLH